MGITFKGKGLEKFLADCIEFLTGEGVRHNDPRGDLRSTHPRMFGAFVEAKNKAWNQVRPWKYLVHVGCIEGDYYVVPPHFLVQKACRKRGQHTCNPFECMGISNPSRTNWAREYRVEEEDLAQAILDAYEVSHSPENIKYRDFMVQARTEAEVLTEQLHNKLERL